MKVIFVLLFVFFNTFLIKKKFYFLFFRLFLKFLDYCFFLTSREYFYCFTIFQQKKIQISLNTKVSKNINHLTEAKLKRSNI